MSNAQRVLVETPMTMALRYASLGYYVFPVREGTKRPYIEEWQNRASKEPAQIREWWRQHPKAGIAVHCGRSGLAAVDVDPRNGGDETVKRLEHDLCPLWDMDCAIAQTGGGGVHYVFRMPEGARLPAKLGPGVDLLHGNHYFIVEPSVHPSGRRYEWEISPFELTELDVLPSAWSAPVDMGASTVDASDALANLPPRPLEETERNAKRVESALSALDPSGPYPEWQTIGFAVLSTGLRDSVQMLDRWSRKAPDRYDARAFRALVRSFKKGRHRGPEIGPGTLFHLAKQAGWEDPTKHDSTDDLEGRFTVIPAHRFASATPVHWVIRGLLPQEGIGVIFGEPGSGKSFLALDLTAAVSRDAEWCGQEVTGGPVVYIAAEGAGGFRKRLRAIAKHQGFPLDGIPLGIISDAPNMLKDDDKALARAIKASGGAVLVVIDTLASVTPGANENSAEDMGAVIARCKRLQEATGATVLLVHHSGKDASRGARGWSGLRGAVDVEIEITRKGDDRLAKVTKQKDGEDGALFPFRLLSVDLGQDDDGVPLTSCVVEHLNTVPEGSRRPPSGSNQQIVFDVVKRLAPCSVDDVLKAAIEKMPHDPEKRDKRRDHAKRALDGLISGKHIICDSQVIRLYGDPNHGWDFPSNESEGDQL